MTESDADRDRRYAREEHERAMERARADEIAHQHAMERMQMMNMAQHAANTQANTAQTGMTAMGTSAPPVVVVSAPAPAPYVATERYCGPISWIIGILVLPCICFCPIDERPVYAAAAAPMYVQTPQPMMAPAQQPMYAPAQQPTYAPAQQPTYAPAQQPMMAPAPQQPYYGMPTQGIPQAKPM